MLGGKSGLGIPKSSRVRMNAVLMYKFTEKVKIYDSKIDSFLKYGIFNLLFREMPAPKLWFKSKGSSIAIHGEFHIFSNFDKCRLILVHTTNLASSNSVASA